MVDREARDLYAEQLRHFASGRITVAEFDRRMPAGVARKDRGIRAVAEEAEVLLDINAVRSGDGLLTLDRDARPWLAGLLMFLYSEEEYRWPVLNLEMTDGAASALGLVFTMGAAGAIAGILHVPMWLGGLAAVAVLSASDFRRLHAHSRGFWPFATQEAFDVARKRPRLLSGGRG
jgi:hypothetical protein